MLIFTDKLSLSIIRWEPICHGFSHFPAFLSSFHVDQINNQQNQGQDIACFMFQYHTNHKLPSLLHMWQVAPPGAWIYKGGMWRQASGWIRKYTSP